MIVLTVLSYNGQPGAPVSGLPLSAQFDELGGTIGRADTNQLVLPDPERTISRVHARIVHRAGRWAIVDTGSNPISVNGRVLDAGREHPLAPGDQLQIGGYLLQVSDALSPTSDDPFADLFGEAARGLAAPANAPPPLPGRPSAPPAPPAPPAALPAAVAAIPEDWDPFADDSPAPAAAAPPGVAPLAGAGPGARHAPAAVLDISLARSDSLDDLFGLGELASAGPLSDPLGSGPAGVLPAQANTASDADPLRALGSSPPVLPPTAADHGSELNMPMPLGPVRAQPAPGPVLPPRGAVFSWDDPPREGRVVTLPGVRQASGPGMASAGLPAARAAPGPSRPSGQPAQSAAIADQRPPVASPPAAGVVAHPPLAGGVANPPAAPDRLLQALLDGLATPGLRMESLQPETLRLMGALLREATQGTVQLLAARAAFKRELRAEMTMIVARENNPLKFSPTVEVGLAHLLGPPTPGFMPPAEALRDAYDDLRAHQLGVMAGMRAALEGVLQRFDPQQLEAQLTHRSALSSLIPATRKARLWELFQELFSQLQREAQDDFDELFGKAFLRAYEEQLDRLQAQHGVGARDGDGAPGAGRR